MVYKVKKKRKSYKTGYEDGHKKGKAEVIKQVLEIVDVLIDEYQEDIIQYPRNSKFVEISLDAMIELKERLSKGKLYIEREL